MKKLLRCAAAALAALLVCAGWAAVAEPGDALPGLNHFTAATLWGEPFTEADLAGADLTVVNIWSVTCGPCIEEMPELAAFGRALPENVRLIGICYDAYLDEDGVKDFLEQLGFEGATLTSGDGDFTALMNEVLYTPTTLFLDAEGNPAALPLIGSPENVEETYLALVNEALTALGKPVIALEAEDGQ